MKNESGISKAINNFLDETSSVVFLILSCFLAFSLLIGFLFIDQSQTLANWSDVGATYGILSALYAGLAFAGLFVTIRQQKDQLKMQHKELNLQREELSETREVLDLQRKELKNQSETMKRQQFEGTFFKLLNTCSNRYKFIVFDHLNLDKNTHIHSLVKKLDEIVLNIDDLNQDSNKNLDNINEVFQRYLYDYLKADYRLAQSLAGVFTQLCIYLDQSEYQGHDIYSNLIRLQFNDSDLFLAFYFALNGNILAKEVECFHNYNLFDLLPKSRIPENHLNVFEIFKENKIIPAKCTGDRKDNYENIASGKVYASEVKISF